MTVSAVRNQRFRMLMFLLLLDFSEPKDNTSLFLMCPWNGKGHRDQQNGGIS